MNPHSGLFVLPHSVGLLSLHISGMHEDSTGKETHLALLQHRCIDLLNWIKVLLSCSRPH